MAIFNNSDKQADFSSNITTVAAGSVFTGKIELECELHIDGHFNGDISSKNTVKVGKAGVLKSNVKAEKLIITGKFTGNAECNVIELIDGGEAEGKLVSSSLVIDNKSKFQGESLRKQPSSNLDSANIGKKATEESVLEKITDMDNELDPFKKNRSAKLSNSPKK